ncbi:Nucleotidylyl transferase superfamily protein [Raphanus sativus]|nr:Nucleotidylyl transferase superfamily protein [Raphanus sativus]
MLEQIWSFGAIANLSLYLLYSSFTISQVDIPFKYLSFFLDDDTELEHIKKEYGEGRMQSGAVKQRLTDVLTEIVERHRKARAAVTDEMVEAIMAVRPLPNMFK